MGNISEVTLELVIIALSLSVAIFVVATLYSSVGHGGASGYLMVFALAGLAPEQFRPTALVLNIGVSLLGTIMFYRAGLMRPRLLWPFLLASVPLAWLGGSLDLKGLAFNLILAATLFGAALRIIRISTPQQGALRPVLLPGALAAGGGIGLVSGLAGVGGGIFLTPLLIVCRWADPREAAAVSAPFILLNSAAGLLGMGERATSILPVTPLLMAAALGGGLIGSRWGSGHASRAALRVALAGVMLVAVIKLLII